MTSIAEIFKFGWNPLSWHILPRIHLGSLAVSPHGIGIALGFLLGAQLMVRRSRRFDGPPEGEIWNTLFWALIGAIVGARLAYVIGHFGEVTNHEHDLLGVFKVYNGGISLIGGFTGAILAALPYMRAKKLGFWRMMDLAAPGMALGVIVGRIGDLIIGDHLGKPTHFFLGWRCQGAVDQGPPIDPSVYLHQLHQGSPPSLGCYGLTLHETALYDFVSTIALLGVLLYIGRRRRNLGVLALTFAAWYGTMRVITDFLRVDRRYLGLTGSQISSILAVAAALYLLARYRGAPREFFPPEPQVAPAAGLAATESEQNAPLEASEPESDDSS